MASTASLRWSLLALWLLSAIIVCGIFGERILGHRQLPMRSDEVAASFKTVMAFYIPTIGMMLSYLFSMRQDGQQVSFSTAQGRTIIGLSILYHACFIAVVIMGISFSFFEQTKEAGKGFAENTSTVASLLGGLSLLLIPVNIVFLKPDKKKEGDTHSP